MSVENVTPYGSGASKREQIAQAFDVIAHRYDRLNRILSLGIDSGWRRRALRLLTQDVQPERVLDVATGTADFAILAARLLPQAHVTGIDLSEGMLTIGRAKVQRARLGDRIDLIRDDCLALPFADSAFDAVTVAFGVRNFENIVAGLTEMYRVLAPDGRVVILELSRPERVPMRPLFRFYLRVVMPLLGRLFSGHAREYRYLPDSIEQVPQGDAMLKLLRAAGFDACQAMRYTFGTCSCYTGRRIT
ncbi:MAG TPA: bifunctional demethylmenaquinone methyltransferase/2-methoxy-6-polyprenyl-1,4-benzoquinol methylase UbiE [Kiritimatiellia bacterium]|nr:bifunctional demethylmenaquinone methyltransferase/2-methoxy-6-polyprenyl-1,4-benzoquinol methylase UbiE [Kiritimatiellia bacterium]HRU70633.1 bifunctional demethylmenaquinone methyltransferase/2-methoxy-6-polyprenyl-1,4-benzoquinol methylase UbiE [Kiritimatiellia bacterium]